MKEKIFPTLHAKNKNGVWKEWRISVMMKGDDNPTIEVRHGQKNGKMTTDTQTITEKKRGYETLWDQAVFTAQSKWNHKHNRENYTTSEKDNDIRRLSPMLAKTYEDGRHLQFPLYVQPKIDGLRCLAHHDGLFSRTGCPFLGLDPIRSDLKGYFEKNEGFVVDGELYSGEMPFEELSGYCRRKKEIPSGKGVVFHVFDVIPPTEMDFEDRLGFFPKETGSIRHVRTLEIQKEQEIAEHLNRCINEGYEGIIIRNKKGAYRTGHRSWDLQKYKLFHEEEFVITGFKEGTGREKGLVIWECQTSGGKTFNARPDGDHENRRMAFQNAEQQIGKKITIVFQEHTKDGVPRFPVAKAIRENF